MTREQFMASFPPIRLDAFENYIRGILATSYQQKIHYFHDAVKLNPNYTLAMLQLGKTYYDEPRIRIGVVLVCAHTQDELARG